MIMMKKALINVNDNTGIEEFIKNLQEKFAFEIYSTDLSYENLKKYGFNIEKFDNKNDDFDIVVCNFFSLNQYINKNTDEEEIMKKFDVEGISILQRYSKRYSETLLVTSPNQYETVIEYLKNGSNDEKLRLKYVQKALLLINQINSNIINITGGADNFKTINVEKSNNLIYGENPHQKAFMYDIENMISYEIIADKELSYNNFLDINLATSIVSEFFDVNACVITRQAMPCAAALGASLDIAYAKATDCDPVSAFGGVVAFSQKVDVKTAKLLSSMFMEVIIAPAFEEEALEILQEKSLKLIKINTPLKDYKNYLQQEVLRTPFGILVQDFDNSELKKNTFKVVSKKKPTTEIVEDMVFAWKICKYTRSNAAVVVKDLKTVGIAQGQANRIDAIDIALDRACENSKDAIMATDGHIASTEGILDAAQARIAGIIQPGGSKKDKEIIASADKYELTMITTGLRQFRNK